MVDSTGDPVANMARDEQLAGQVCNEKAPPFLRLYRWSEPCLSVGLHQQPADLPQELLESRLPIVRRPTGGGAVFHRLDELTYSMGIPRRMIPKGIRLSRLPGLFHEKLRDELVKSGGIRSGKLSILCAGSKGPATICFDSPVCGDLLYEGRKVAGSALRVWRKGLLIQGTIQRLPIEEELLMPALSLAALGIFLGLCS